MKRPGLLLLLATVAGALIGWLTNVHLFFFVPGALFLLFLPQRHKRIALLVFVLFLLTILQARQQKLQPLSETRGAYFPARLLITQIGSRTDFTKNYTADLLLPNGTIPVRFQTAAGEEELLIGEIVRTRVQNRRPDRTQNDLFFSYGDYLLRSGEKGLLRAEGAVVSEGVSQALTHTVRRNFMLSLEQAARDLFPNDTAALMLSVWTGRSFLAQETQAGYRDLGIAHLFAVSGLHIGILFAGVQLVAGQLLGKNRARLLGLLLIFFYTWLIGFPVSAVRACMMAFVFVLARSFRKGHDPLTALFFSMTIILLLFPGSIVDAGFHLSAAGVASVLWVRPVFLRRMGYEGSPVLSSLAVQLGILPALLLHFESAPLAAVLANLLLIPLFGLMIGVATAAVLFYFLFLPAAQLAAAAAGGLAEVFFLLTDAIRDLSLPAVSAGRIGISEVLWAYLLLYLVLRPATWRSLPMSLQKGLLRACAGVWLVGIFLQSYLPASVFFIDIGQGDAALIRDAGLAFLVDTGGEVRQDLSDSFETILRPSLQREGVRALDGVFISHFDADHMENLAALAAAVPVRALYLPQGLSETEEAAAVLADVSAQGVPIVFLHTGDRLAVSGGSSFDVLHDARYGDPNDSLILRYNHEYGSVLFAGDLEASGEGKLSGDLRAAVLKVGHHGSRTSTTDGFLERVQPEAAVITAGHANLFGHPHEEVLTRLEAHEIPVYRTDMLGNLRILMTWRGPVFESYPVWKKSAGLWSLPLLFPIGIWSEKISRRYYAAHRISKITE